MATFEPNWSELPNEILGSVRQRLPMVENIRISAVCNSWHSVASDNSYPTLPPLPWLMLPYKSGQERQETRNFFNISDQKTYKMKLTKEISHSKCVGSSFGWLVIVDRFCSVLLMNPFSGAIIHLPPTETFPDVLGAYRSESSGEIEHFIIRQYVGRDREFSRSPARLRSTLIGKAIVTADPSVDNNYMVVAAGFSGLAFCKAGADSWTQLDRRSCEDIMYLNGSLFVLHAFGGVVAWAVNGGLSLNKSKVVGSPLGELALELPIQPSEGSWFIKKNYLVESSGDLLRVLLWFFKKEGTGRTTYESASCSVHRLDPRTKTWIEVVSLHDRVLFLGRNSAISLSAHDFPECRENSLYFAEYFWKGWLQDDDHNVAHHNLGVFNLEERRFVKYSSCVLQRIQPPLVWVLPNFQ